MNSASDYGYTQENLLCIACGSQSIDCCDGKGSPLPDAVKMLFRMKRNLMHQRRFGSDTLNAYRNTVAATEGDIEEWLIENGFLPGDGA